VKLDSGKLSVLADLLHTLRETKEKIVLVSNFTRTLDILQALLQAHNMSWCRLDGSTESSKRQQIVDHFNRVDADTCCPTLINTIANK
jgi:DNA repair and recombination protein RAD54B